MTQFENWAFGPEGGWKYDPRKIDETLLYTPRELIEYEEKAFNAGIAEERKRILGIIEKANLVSNFAFYEIPEGDIRLTNKFKKYLIENINI